MNRFRPNLIVTGSGPWQEDQWQAFEIAHDSCLTKFRSVKPCSRCKVSQSAKSGFVKVACRLGFCASPSLPSCCICHTLKFT